MNRNLFYNFMLYKKKKKNGECHMLLLKIFHRNYPEKKMDQVLLNFC